MHRLAYIIQFSLTRSQYSPQPPHAQRLHFNWHMCDASTMAKLLLNQICTVSSLHCKQLKIGLKGSGLLATKGTTHKATPQELLSKVHNFPLHYEGFLLFISSTTTWHAAMLRLLVFHVWTKFKHMCLLGNSTAQTPDIVLIIKMPRRVPRFDAFSLRLYSFIRMCTPRRDATHGLAFFASLSPFARRKKCRRLCVSRLRWLWGVAT